MANRKTARVSGRAGFRRFKVFCPRPIFFRDRHETRRRRRDQPENRLNSSAIPKRSKEEYILLTLCATGFAGILPFAILRVVSGDMLLAAIDATLVIGVLLIGVHVWNTRNVRLPSIVLTVFYLTGVVAAVYASGGKLIYWAYPGMLAAFFLVKPNEAAVFNTVAILALLPLLASHLQPLEMSSVVVTLILNTAFSYIFGRKMLLQHKELETLATRDSLTGAGNRRLFDEKVQDCLNHYERSQVPAALILLDIDHFKKINDKFGHGKGDEVLINLVELLRQRLRAVDGIYRIGGEEFAVVIHPADIDAVIDLAEALRRLIETSTLLAGERITISVGLAICNEGDSVKSWVERADRALYKAKNSGRNKTCLEPNQGKIF